MQNLSKSDGKNMDANHSTNGPQEKDVKAHDVVSMVDDLLTFVENYLKSQQN